MKKYRYICKFILIKTIKSGIYLQINRFVGGIRATKSIYIPDCIIRRVGLATIVGRRVQSNYLRNYVFPNIDVGDRALSELSH